jgi:hypothetical protein
MGELRQLSGPGLLHPAVGGEDDAMSHPFSVSEHTHPDMNSICYIMGFQQAVSRVSKQ